MGRELRSEKQVRGAESRRRVATYLQQLGWPHKAAELYRLALDRDPYVEYDLKDRLTAVSASIEA